MSEPRAAGTLIGAASVLLNLSVVAHFERVVPKNQAFRRFVVLQPQ